MKRSIFNLPLLLSLWAAASLANAQANAASEISLVNRTPYHLETARAIRIDTSAPGLQWRVVWSRSAADFPARLQESEAGIPFDLVFPIRIARSLDPRASESVESGLLADRFSMLSLPAAGLEFRIEFDGRWSAFMRQEGDEAVRLSGDGNRNIHINAWNSRFDPDLADGLQGWTQQPEIAANAAQGEVPLWHQAAPFRSNPWGRRDLPEALLYPLRDWRDYPIRILRSASQPLTLPQGERHYLLFGSLTDRAMQRGATRGAGALQLQVSGMESSPRSATVLGGSLPLMIAGEVQSLEAASSAARGQNSSWIAFSSGLGAVLLGCSTPDAEQRGAPLAPADLLRLLEPYSPSDVAICATAERPAVMRWMGEWLGARSPSDALGITAALCLRLSPHPDESHWENLLRPWNVVVEARNADQTGLPDAVRDGRFAAEPELNSFWWATPRRVEEPVAIEFDLGSPREVFWIDMHHAGVAGFSSHANTESYRWEIRPSDSSGWVPVAEANGNDLDSTRHILSPPVQARRWRLVFPPPDDPALRDGRVVRMAEIQMWGLVSRPAAAGNPRATSFSP